MTSVEQAFVEKFDKATWQTWRFDELVENIVERVVPKESGLKKYFGLEHLDSGSLHISRWGDPQSLGGDKLKIYEGDLIFAKRNAYLKRVAIADCDAVASAHSMVLRAKVGAVNPSFLPFFLLSDYFWSRAIKISVGSLSPTINWKALAKQEFLLPPKDQQAEIAELLWALDEVKCQRQEVYNRLKALFTAQQKVCWMRSVTDSTRQYQGLKFPAHWDLIDAESIGSVDYGISASVANNKDPSIGWPIITGANITLEGRLDFSKKRFIEEPSKSRFILEPGDLLFNWRSGSIEHVGKTALFEEKGDFTFASFILRLRCGSSTHNRYMFYLLNFMRQEGLFGANSAQQINFKLNASIFRKLRFPIPPLKEQMRIVAQLDTTSQIIESIEDSVDLSRDLTLRLASCLMS